MSSNQIMLIGSLPPTRSHAAVCMDMLAHSLSESGFSVTCLIDTLAPSPSSAATYKTERRNQLSDSTALREMPRLFVAGNGGDSLFVFEMMQSATGGTIITDQSLLPLAPAIAEISGHSSKELIAWFEDKYHAAGRLAAQAAYTHRRISNQLPHTVNAYGFALNNIQFLIALSENQKETFGAIDNQAEVLSAELLSTPLRPAAISLQSFAIVGASKELQAEVTTNIEAGPLNDRVGMLWLDRFLPDCMNRLKDADAIIILDAQDAAICPLFLSAVSSGKLALDVGQHWAGEHSTGASLPTLTPHPSSVLHAIAALHTIDGLADRLIKLQAQAVEKNGIAGLTADSLYELALEASKNTPLKSDILTPLLSEVTNNGESKVVGERGKIADGSILVGAVPIRPILKQQYPDLDPDTCPNFIERATLAAAAEFTSEHPENLAAKMGFEAPIWSATAPDNWASVRSGLINDSSGFIWGGHVSAEMAEQHHLALAHAGALTATWDFQLSEVETSLPPLKTGAVSGFLPSVDTYWRYDTLRKTLKLCFLTGGEGSLEVRSKGEDALLMYDAVHQNLAETSAREPVEVKVAHHGLAIIELAALRSNTSQPHHLLQQMSETGLSFIWSAE